jgi:hypothetical protein
MPAASSYGMGADAWPGMNVVIGANNRSSISSITWT